MTKLYMQCFYCREVTLIDDRDVGWRRDKYGIAVICDDCLEERI